MEDEATSRDPRLCIALMALRALWSAKAAPRQSQQSHQHYIHSVPCVGLCSQLGYQSYSYPHLSRNPTLVGTA